MQENVLACYPGSVGKNKNDLWFLSPGKIQWARSLFLHLEEPMMFFKDHAVLLKMPEGKEAVRKYNRIGKTLVQYELAYYDAWRKQSVSPAMFVFFQSRMEFKKNIWNHSMSSKVTSHTLETIITINRSATSRSPCGARWWYGGPRARNCTWTGTRESPRSCMRPRRSSSLASKCRTWRNFFSTERRFFSRNGTWSRLALLLSQE